MTGVAAVPGVPVVLPHGAGWNAHSRAWRRFNAPVVLETQFARVNGHHRLRQQQWTADNHLVRVESKRANVLARVELTMQLRAVLVGKNQRGAGDAHRESRLHGVIEDLGAVWYLADLDVVAALGVGHWPVVLDHRRIDGQRVERGHLE